MILCHLFDRGGGWGVHCHFTRFVAVAFAFFYKGESHGKVPEERETIRSNGLTGGLCGVNVCNCVFGSVGVFAQPVYLFDGWALPCGLLQF